MIIIYSMRRKVVLPVTVAASCERQIRTASASVSLGSARNLWRVSSSLTPITIRSRNVSLEIAMSRSLYGEQAAAEHLRHRLVLGKSHAACSPFKLVRNESKGSPCSCCRL